WPTSQWSGEVSCRKVAKIRLSRRPAESRCFLARICMIFRMSPRGSYKPAARFKPPTKTNFTTPAGGCSRIRKRQRTWENGPGRSSRSIKEQLNDWCETWQAFSRRGEPLHALGVGAAAPALSVLFQLDGLPLDLGICKK